MANGNSLPPLNLGGGNSNKEDTNNSSLPNFAAPKKTDSLTKALARSAKSDNSNSASNPQAHQEKEGNNNSTGGSNEPKAALPLPSLGDLFKKAEDKNSNTAPQGGLPSLDGTNPLLPSPRNEEEDSVNEATRVDYGTPEETILEDQDDYHDSDEEDLAELMALENGDAEEEEIDTSLQELAELDPEKAWDRENSKEEIAIEDMEFEDRILATIPLDDILGDAIDMDASDVEIQPGSYVAFQIRGDNYPQHKYGVITRDQTNVLIRKKIKASYQNDLNTNLELDASYTLDEGRHAGRRTRLAVALTFQEYALKFRIISEKIPHPDDLKVPQIFRDWIQYREGLFFICGSTGTGKTTTLASLLNQVVLNDRKVIYTIEKPIEYLYPTTGLSQVTQREVAGLAGNQEVSITADTRSFASALDTAMRWAPDIILVGEIRNYAEADQALKASESGHLTVSTMHTNNAVQTLERFSRIFEVDERDRVMSSVADSAVGFANQILVKSKDGNSRFALHEILEIDEEVRKLIGDQKLDVIQNMQIESKATMEHSLARAVDEDRTTLEEAWSFAKRKDLFRDILAGKK